MGPLHFVKSLRALKFTDAFNPYADRCVTWDRHDAPVQRARALREMLEAAVAVEVDSIWIGRDLGYRGGRRTGLALTDDMHIQAHAARWRIEIVRPTVGHALAERTAAVIWGILARVSQPVFLWNVFPLHPHEPDEPFSNRPHKANERDAGEQVLSELIALLKPKRLVAIGGNAAISASRVGACCEVIAVRHPSYGGQNEFVAQMKELYALGDERRKLL